MSSIFHSVTNLMNVSCENTNIALIKETNPSHSNYELNIHDTSFDVVELRFFNLNEKYNLTKLKYPACAEAAIKAMVDVALMDDITEGKKIQVQSYLMNEFIFEKIEKLDKRGIPRVLSEYQLINILTNFIWTSHQTPDIRNAIILNIFPCGNPRYDYLGNFICFSICLSHAEILDAAGIWMQQAGSTSESCQKLAIYIVEYFCHISPNSMSNLIEISTLSPYFNANLMTAIVEAFRTHDPSDQLLYLIDAWIKINPNVLTISLNYKSSLPPGGIYMTPILPIIGLLRWCILNPTRQETYFYDKNNMTLSKRFMIYYEIHYQLLIALFCLKDSQSKKHAISAQDLEELMQTLIECLQSRLPYISKSSYILAIGRLFEVIHVIMTVNCIYGNTQKLQNLLEILKKIHFDYIHPS